MLSASSHRRGSFGSILRLDSLTPLERTAFKHYIVANLFRVQDLYVQFRYELLDENAFRTALAALTFYGRYAEHLNLPQKAISEGLLEERGGADLPEGWCFGLRTIGHQGREQ